MVRWFDFYFVCGIPSPPITSLPHKQIQLLLYCRGAREGRARGRSGRWWGSTATGRTPSTTRAPWGRARPCGGGTPSGIDFRKIMQLIQGTMRHLIESGLFYMIINYDFYYFIIFFIFFIIIFYPPPKLTPSSAVCLDPQMSCPFSPFYP